MSREVSRPSVRLNDDYFSSGATAGTGAKDMVRDRTLSAEELGRMDTDGDGRLSVEEVQAAGFTDEADARAIARSARSNEHGFTPLQVNFASSRPQNEGEALLMDHFGLDRITARPAKRGQSRGVHANGHPGIDLTARDGRTAGHPVRALLGPKGGTVEDVGTSESMGNFVLIRDNATGMLTKYMHMQKRPTLHRGDAVTPDQELGKVGNTGFSTGAHLHFEVRDADDHVVIPADFASTIAAQQASAADPNPT